MRVLFFFEVIWIDVPAIMLTKFLGAFRILRRPEFKKETVFAIHQLPCVTKKSVLSVFIYRMKEEPSVKYRSTAGIAPFGDGVR
jgi:hypothetical protein